MFPSLKNFITSLVEDTRLQKFEDKDCTRNRGAAYPCSDRRL